MAPASGLEYFWMVKRVLDDYKIPESVIDDVFAESIFYAFVLPYPLTFNLIRWCVFRSIKKYCVPDRKYTLVSFDEVDDSFVVWQPEISDDKIVDLTKFRSTKKLSM